MPKTMKQRNGVLIRSELCATPHPPTLDGSYWSLTLETGSYSLGNPHVFKCAVSQLAQETIVEVGLGTLFRLAHILYFVQ